MGSRIRVVILQDLPVSASMERDRLFRAEVLLVGHSIGRVGPDHCCLNPRREALPTCRLGRVGAEKTVLAEDPQVPEPGGGLGRPLWNLVRVDLPGAVCPLSVGQARELGRQIVRADREASEELGQGLLPRLRHRANGVQGG